MDDVVWLSRVQFALTIMFHYLFPPLTIGMGVVLVYLEAMYLIRKEDIYETAAKFWTKIFALNFALGVATGIVMEFQFGTNWAAYSRFVGDVFGSALAAEGIFAFFLESGFLAVLVFGWDRVSPKFHFFATLMVALGSIFSAVWIIVANSWQQTPAGHELVQHTIAGETYLRAQMVSFSEVLFNPSTIQRLVHTLIGAFILGAFFIMSISAYYLLKRRHEEFARRSFTGALVLAAVASLGALVSGDTNSRMVGHHQPAKLAAFEGHFETGPASLSIIGLPDTETGEMKWDLAVPGLLSFFMHGDFSTPVAGLDQFPQEQWPPVLVSFASYHIMVALGMYFIFITLLALFFRVRQTLFQKRWLLWIFVFSVVGPFIANEIGWVAAEVGRQPWSVYPEVNWSADGTAVSYDTSTGLLTADAASTNLSPGQVIGSITMFSLIYLLLLGIWLFVLNHKIQAGPEPVRLPDRTTPRGFREATTGRTTHHESMTEAKEADQENEPR